MVKIAFAEKEIKFHQKAIFTVHTLDMTISPSLQYSSRNAVSIPARKNLSENIFLAENTLYMIFDQKFFRRSS